MMSNVNDNTTSFVFLPSVGLYPERWVTANLTAERDVAGAGVGETVEGAGTFFFFFFCCVQDERASGE